MFTLGTFYWPNGRSDPPENMRTKEEGDCPFDDDDVKTSTLGNVIALLVCVLLCIISAGVTFYIWKRFWRLDVIPLTTRKPFGQADIILCATIFAEGM